MTSLLIIDDNTLNLRLIDYVLQSNGYEVHTAGNADDALKTLSSFKPDLILMDLQLPGMDGFELTKIIKNDPVNQSIPIIAITALAMKGDKEKALAAGCDGYIKKPIDVDTIHLTIQEFVQQFKK